VASIGIILLHLLWYYCLLAYTTVFHHLLILLSADIRNTPTIFGWETDLKSAVTNMVMQILR